MKLNLFVTVYYMQFTEYKGCLNVYSSNHAFIAAGAKQKHNKNTPFMMYTYMHFLNYIRELFWYISIKHCLSGSDVEILVMQCHGHMS